MNKHEEAAHSIAKALRTIARLLPDLSAEGCGALLLGLKIEDAALLAECRIAQADRLEASAPFTPLTEAQKSVIWEDYADAFSDFSTCEHIEMMVDDWTEADWRAAFDGHMEQLGAE